MSLDKSEVRIGVANEIGCTLDDLLEAAKGEVKFFEGGVNVLVQAQRQVQALAKLVDDDLDGKGEGLIKDLETASVVKKYITRAVAVLESGAKSSDNMRLISEGKIRAYTGAVASVKKRVDLEHARINEARLEAAKIASGGGNGGPRAVGTHPGASVKTQRLAEDLVAQTPSKKRTRRAKRGPDA